MIQHEKFGIYNLHRVENDGRAVFKHCQHEVFLYHYRTPRGWGGWVVGPIVGNGRGGLIMRSEEICVEKAIGRQWQFYDNERSTFLDDPTVAVTCFTGEWDGRN